MIFYNPAEPVRRLNTTFMFKISPFTQEQLDCMGNVMWQNIQSIENLKKVKENSNVIYIYMF